MSRSREMWDIAHEWAYDRDGKGIGAGANILYGNGCIYSYGNHFMIARHVRNGKGEQAVLFTERTYSNTTAKHIKAVGGAVSHLKTLYVPDPAQEKEQLFNEWYLRMVDAAKPLANAKKPGKYVIQIEEVYNEAKAYADFFGYTLPKQLADMGAVSSQDEFQAHLKAEREAQKQQQAVERRKQSRLHNQKLKAWRAFEITNFYGRDGWDYLRCNVPACTIETTQQVSIPLDTAKAFYQVVKSTVAKGGCRDCGMLFMGQYPVLEINKQFVKVGCHQVSMKEIERLAFQQGWQ